MDYTHRARQANDIPAPGPSRGRYDEDAVRRGARELIAEQRRRETRERVCAEVADEITALKAENARLRECIKALEREGLNLDAREERRFAEIADRHNWCETPRAGQVENFR